MTIQNALEILRKKAEKNPQLHAAFIEEKKKYRIAYKLRECRKRKGLSQKELAKCIGTTQSVISRLENTDYAGYSVTLLEKISKALSEPITTFFEAEEDLHQENFHMSKGMAPIISSKAFSYQLARPDQILKRHHAR